MVGSALMKYIIIHIHVVFFENYDEALHDAIAVIFRCVYSITVIPYYQYQTQPAIECTYLYILYMIGSVLITYIITNVNFPFL